MAAPLSPELFGDFLLLQRLAQSAMAEVLLAVRLGDRSGRTFVVKRPVLGERASGRAAQAIAREAEVLGAVRAPGLPALEAAGEIAGLPYVALEHVRGAPLDELLRRTGALPPPAAAAIARDLARTLAALHAAGWVHGDVTPSNVIVDDAGEARLLDLGLARRTGEKRPEVAGKPGYVAPEAALTGAASPAEDAYGLGVVLAECVIGRRLFPERDLVEAATRADVPQALEALDGALPGVSAALARRPDQRPSMDALLERLAPLLVDRSGLADLAARPTQVPEEPATQPEAPPQPAPPQPTMPSPQAATTAPENVLTPTAPLVLPQRPGPTLAMSPARDDPRAAAAPPSARLWLALVVLSAILSLLIGVLVGRALGRNRPGTFSIAGPLPRRAQIELDGRPFTQPLGGGPATIEPGEHTLTIVLSRANRREYTFHVRPNEHVVILAAARRPGGGGGDEEAP